VATVWDQSTRIFYFSKKVPADHHLRAAVDARARIIKTVEEAVAAEAERRYVAAEKAFASGDVRAIAEASVFGLDAFSPPRDADPSAPGATTLRLGDLAVPVLPPGGGVEGLMAVVSSLIDRYDHDLSARMEAAHTYGPWPYREALSTFLTPRLGGRLYGAEAHVDKKALKKLLAAVWTAPDSLFLGVAARAVYALHRDACRTAAVVYVALRDTVGKPAALAAYKAALARDGGRKMYEAYHDLASAHGILAAAAPASSHEVEYLTGFWVRRMADGTDGDLFAFLTKVLKAYDPDFHPAAPH